MIRDQIIFLALLIPIITGDSVNSFSRNLNEILSRLDVGSVSSRDVADSQRPHAKTCRLGLAGVEL